MKKHARWPRENTLTCSIRHIILNLDSNHPVSIPYTALSYTWGDGKVVTSLKLQEEETKKSGEITVTSSLVTALQTILEPRNHYALWTDQICINQSNTEEKGQQVRFMRWIYERATFIHVWLGPTSEDSDKAMMYLRNHDRVSIVRDVFNLYEIPLRPSLEKALFLLLSRPYWSRTWTVQELTGLDPQQVIISCGHESVPLTRIFESPDAALSVFNRDSNRLLHYQGARITQMQIFWYQRRNPVQPLMVLVGGLRKSMASDPRDKIYSMLNFATDVHGSEITPDYTKTVKQTLTEVVLWSIWKYKCLDILGECSPSLKDDAAPSWVPNWGDRGLMVSFRKWFSSDDPGSSPLYQASGEHAHILNIHYPVDVNTKLLVLSGVKIAKLDLVLNKVAYTYSSWARLETWAPKNGDAICPLNMILMREVFRRTIYLDVYIVAPLKYARGNEFPLPWCMETSAGSLEQVASKMEARDMGYGRCPFYTAPGIGSSHGLLGYSVLTARPGDELWILKGGSMPFILRPKAVRMPITNLETGEAFEHSVDAGMPTYELVSEAFVLGLMDGEIIDMLGETPRRERPPPLADMDKSFRTIGLI